MSDSISSCRCRYRSLFNWLILLLISGCAEQSSKDNQTTRRSNEVSQEVLSHSATEVAADDSDPDAPVSFRFREIGKDSGFDFERYDDIRGQHRIAEANGGGVAIFDFDHDGWLDVFMSNGCRLPLNTDLHETPGKLFRNRPDLNFLSCNESSRLQQFGYCYGCAIADSNEDGFEDLYITAFRRNQFWCNNGDGTFSEIATENGTLTGVWGSSAAFADLNGDQCLDLYVVNYLEEDDEKPLLCPDPGSPDGFVGCSPALFSGVSDTLFLSDGSGNYVNASEEAGLTNLVGKGLGVVICDLGGDDRPEIYVANDGEPNFLLAITEVESRIPGPSRIQLHDCAIAANAALNENGYAQASMGIAAADFDREGHTDLFLTHFFGDTNTFVSEPQPGRSLYV